MFHPNPVVHRDERRAAVRALLDALPDESQKAESQKAESLARFEDEYEKAAEQVETAQRELARFKDLAAEQLRAADTRITDLERLVEHLKNELAVEQLDNEQLEKNLLEQLKNEAAAAEQQKALVKLEKAANQKLGELEFETRWIGLKNIVVGQHRCIEELVEERRADRNRVKELEEQLASVQHKPAAACCTSPQFKAREAKYQANIEQLEAQARCIGRVLLAERLADLE